MKKTADEILKDHIRRYKLTDEYTGNPYLQAMEEYLQQGLAEFKVEPGLSLQQCKEQIAKTYSYLDANMTKIKYESWDAFIGGASIQDTEDAIDEILELHTASLTSEIKGLREAIEPLLKWNEEYPPGRTYSYGEAESIENKLTAAIDKIKEAFNTPNN